MANPRIEEVDDVSDPEEMDLDAFDFARPGQTTLDQAQTRSQPQQQQRQQQQQQPNADMMAQMQQMLSGQGGGGGGGMPQMDQKERMRIEREQQEKAKSYQCIYPIYFDASRSREEGRRVKKEDAVRNPLARDIVDALQNVAEQTHVALQIVFEPSKCHPKDWANPGRVKVLVKKDGEPITAKIANSEYKQLVLRKLRGIQAQDELESNNHLPEHHLYKMVAAYLKKHPTTEQSPLKLRVPGLPMPKDNKVPAPAVPRGFKMGSILPLHSPALSGGGVSDNMMADMMKELQGGGGGMPSIPGMGGMGGGGGGAGLPPQMPTAAQLNAAKGKKGRK